MGNNTAGRSPKAATLKQQTVLEALRAGWTLDAALDNAQVSLSGENRAVFVMRLIRTGHLTVVPTPDGVTPAEVTRVAAATRRMPNGHLLTQGFGMSAGWTAGE